jgi:hypothetical protein
MTDILGQRSIGLRTVTTQREFLAARPMDSLHFVYRACVNNREFVIGSLVSRSQRITTQSSVPRSPQLQVRSHHHLPACIDRGCRRLGPTAGEGQMLMLGAHWN